jgi:hypothetical protein
LNLVDFWWRFFDCPWNSNLTPTRRFFQKKINQAVHQFSIHSSKKFTFSLSSEIFHARCAKI